MCRDGRAAKTQFSGEFQWPHWKRFWTAAADEGTLIADARATRRKERRRLQKEYELALSGRKETKSGEKAIPRTNAAQLHELMLWLPLVLSAQNSRR